MRLFVFIFSIIPFSSLYSQETGPSTLFDTLYTQNNISLTLTYPFDSLYRSNHNDIEATISIHTSHGYLMKNAPMSLTLRGKFRRMKCVMPPLLLNFKKSTLKDLGLLPIDELKLVTHCTNDSDGEMNLAEERLVYQVYEGISPYSYRTIWINIQYCNTSKPGECISTVAFLLEPDKVISNRLGITERKLFNPSEDSIHFNSYAHTTAYNFLIGNRDWSIVSSRNAKLFYDKQFGKYVVIPYDFDYANIVSATYRRETLEKSMTHPYDRIYFGEYFMDKAGHILKTFYGMEKSIIAAVYAASNPVDPERRKSICQYFNHWFSMVNRTKAEKLQYGIVCRYKGRL